MSDTIGDPSLAGQVARWHTTPTSRAQSVGEHSWQVARILLAIWPEAPQPVLKEALFHDVGEINVGDTPYFAKANPPVRAALHALERTTRLRMTIPWGVPFPPVLDEHALHWLDVAHAIADWEFIFQECVMGNLFMKNWAEIARERVLKMVREAPPNSDLQRARVAEYYRKRWEAWTLL